MRISDCLLKRINSDLALNIRFEKGLDPHVQNVWHFSTDGKTAESMFFDEVDLRDAMNRIFVVSRRHGIVILAFVLMDTHVHFILYGSYDECTRFIQDFVRRTALSIEERHNMNKALAELQISCQGIDTLSYLRHAICYVLRNPIVAGIASSFYDYPWSSAALMFRNAASWTAPRWQQEPRMELSRMSGATRRRILKTHDFDQDGAIDQDGLVFPGDYVAYEIAEKVFRSGKAFFYLMCSTKESDIEEREEMLARLTIPIQELRQRRNEICRELFGKPDSRLLDVSERLRLARTIKSRIGGSPKQIARTCGLIYDEVKELI